MTFLNTKRFYPILLILFLFSMIFRIKAADSRELLDQAKDYFIQGDIVRSEELVKQIILSDPENPMAQILQGLFLLKKDDLFSRIEAREIIEKNLYKVKNNAFAHYALGLVYKTAKFRNMARKEFEKAVTLNLQFIEAHLELAEYYFKDMLQYYYRITDTAIPLSFREYAIDDYDNAVYHLKQVLEKNPLNERALYLLGNIHYEMEDYREMENVFRRALISIPDHKDFNLFLGLALLAQHRYSEAAEYFDRAIKQMSPEKRKLFLNPEFLIKNKSEKEKAEDNQELYWKVKDPMFLTEENERLLEHFGRVAYANMRFSIPRMKVEGWKTDRGKTYIRYGKPNYIIDYGKSMDFNAIYPPTQIWGYPEFQLMFSDEFWNGHYQFTQPIPASRSAFKERTIFNFKLIAENVFQKIPESFDFSLPGGTFFSPFRIAFFKDEKNTEALLSFGLPIDKKSEEENWSFLVGFFLLGDNKLPIFHHKKDFKISKEDLEKCIKNGYLVNNINFFYFSGVYNYSFEILDQTLERNFVYRDRLTIPDYSYDTLMISDLLLANDITTDEEKGYIKKNEFYILPNVLHEFSADKKLFIYFEIYNLSKDSLGFVYYTVENRVVRQKQGNIFKRFFEKRGASISIINKYTGQKTTESVVKSIDIGNLKSGEYRLEIRVEDQSNGKKVLQKTKFTVVHHLTD